MKRKKRKKRKNKNEKRKRWRGRSEVVWQRCRTNKEGGMVERGSLHETEFSSIAQEREKRGMERERN